MVKYKFKMIHVTGDFNGDYYEDYSHMFAGIITDFKTFELDSDEYIKLESAVRHFNKKSKNGKVHIVREMDDPDLKMLFDDYEKYTDLIEKQETFLRQKAEKAKEERALKAKEKKRKQLEKLKKELGED